MKPSDDQTMAALYSLQTNKGTMTHESTTDNTTMTGLVPGTRGRRWPAMACMDNAFTRTNMRGSRLLQKMRDRTEWKRIVHPCNKHAIHEDGLKTSTTILRQNMYILFYNDKVIKVICPHCIWLLIRHYISNSYICTLHSHDILLAVMLFKAVEIPQQATVSQTQSHCLTLCFSWPVCNHSLSHVYIVAYTG